MVMWRRHAVIRSLVGLAAAASFVLFVAVLALWARSRRTPDTIYLQTSREGGVETGYSSLVASSFDGSVLVWYVKSQEWERRRQPRAVRHEPWNWEVRPGARLKAYGLTIPATTLGFGWDKEVVAKGPPVDYDTDRLESTNLVVTLPHAAAALVAGALPAAWVARSTFRRKRRAAGLCATCGYDLRASGERCPECGTPTATRAAA
jgi:hypothetical protein